ncbi:MAG: glutathione S-transferase family protein [Steroidobacter sp.]
MSTLYHCVSARSFRPLWMLEELGIPYDLKVLPFPPRVVARDYLALNPLGTVPAFFDGDVRMTESAAICQYLAVRHAPATLNVQSDEPEFGAYLNWLHFGEATLTFPQTIVLRYSRFESPERRLPQVAEDYTRWFLARLRGIDAVVSRAEFMCARRFTAADISVGYALMLADALNLQPQFPAAIRGYWARLRSRAGFQRALSAQDRAAREQGVSTAPAAEPNSNPSQV